MSNQENIIIDGRTVAVDRETASQLKKNVLVTTVDAVYNWARKNSIWPMAYATACCGIEMIATTGPRFDLSRFGSEVFRATPRQADLIILAGTLTKKMAPVVVNLYSLMPEPKYVVAMGACMITGGPFIDAYSVIKGADCILPCDVYIPGCPPRPEALINGLRKLQEKIARETILERKQRVAFHDDYMMKVIARMDAEQSARLQLFAEGKAEAAVPQMTPAGGANMNIIPRVEIPAAGVAYRKPTEAPAAAKAAPKQQVTTGEKEA